MTEIKAIETVYNGYRFRSRLEARWAVFFDSCGIRYEYEPEGFELSDGSMYLPDFYLSDFNYYVEVKSSRDNALDELYKPYMMINDSMADNIIILSNIPNADGEKSVFWFPAIHRELRNSRKITCDRVTFLDYTDVSEKHVDVLIQDDFHEGCIQNTYNLFHYFIDKQKYPIKKEELVKEINPTFVDDDEFSVNDAFYSTIIASAYISARQARFEHGEKPIIGGK